MGVVIHIAVQYLVDSKPIVDVTQGMTTPTVTTLIVYVAAASTNWLQNALSDMGHSVCGLSPSLGSILLYKINPITLLAAGCSMSLIISKCLIELEYVNSVIDYHGCLTHIIVMSILLMSRLHCLTQLSCAVLCCHSAYTLARSCCRYPPHWS